MSFLTKKGTLVAPTSGTTPVAQSVSGLGFQPKAIIFFWTYQTAEGFSSFQSVGWGWATGTGTGPQGAISYASDDNVATNSNAGKTTTNARLIKFLSAGTPTAAGEANLGTFDSNGFTINWQTLPSQANIVHFLALGGSDLTNAKAATANIATASGNQSFTGVGFQPDLVLFFGTRNTTASVTNASARAYFGVAKNSSTRAVAAISELDNQVTSTVARYQKTDKCIASLAETVITYEADFVSMDADGFTINFAVAPGVADNFFYLALKGGRYNVISETQKSSTGTKSKTGIGFKPSGLLLFGVNAVSNASLDSTAQKLSLGAASSVTEQGHIWGTSTDDAVLTNTDSRTTTGALLSHCNNTGAADAEADLSSFDSDGFTLDWTTADATEREFIGVAFGPSTHDITTSNTANATDLTERSNITIRELSDTANSADLVERSNIVGRELSDTAISSDLVERSSVLTRVFSDTANASDLVERSNNLLRDSSNTVVAADLAERSNALIRDPTDVVIATDFAEGSSVLVRELADTAIVSDLADRSSVLIRLLSDISSASEDLVSNAAVTRSINEAVNSSDIPSTSSIVARSLDDTANATDSLSSFPAFVRGTGNGVSISDFADAVRLLVSYSVNTVDTALVSDSASRLLIYIENISHTVPVSSAINLGGGSLSRSLNDIILNTSSVSRSTNQVRNPSDLVIVVDSLESLFYSWWGYLILQTETKTGKTYFESNPKL